MTRIINRGRGRGGGPSSNIPNQTIGRGTHPTLQSSGQKTMNWLQSKATTRSSGRGTNLNHTIGRGTDATLQGSAPQGKVTTRGSGRGVNPNHSIGRGTDATLQGSGHDTNTAPQGKATTPGTGRGVDPNHSIGRGTDATLQGSGHNTHTAPQGKATTPGTGRGVDPNHSIGRGTDATLQGSGHNTNTAPQELATTPGTGRGTNPSNPGTGRGTDSLTPGTGRGTNPSNPGTGRGTDSLTPGTGRGTDPTRIGTLICTNKGSAGRGGSDALSTTRRVIRQENRVTDLTREEESVHDDSCDDHEDEPDVPVPTRNARKVCRVSGNRLVTDDDYTDATISKIITQIIRKSIVDNGFQWKNVPESQHEIYFDEFKKFYTWTEDYAWIKQTCLKHFGRQYSRWIYRVKKARNTRGKPKALSDAGWKLFQEHWDLDSTKKKSDKMVANRKAGESKHSGGSRSTRCHKKTLTKELGREPNLYEIMRKTHLKKDGSGYIDEKARKIDEEVTARVESLKRLASSSDGVDGEFQGEPNIDDVYLSVSGVVNKQQVFGAGSISHSITSKRQKIQTNSSLEEDETVRSQIVEQAKAEAKEEMKEEMEEEIERRLNVRLAVASEEIKADLMKSILAEIRSQPPT